MTGRLARYLYLNLDNSDVSFIYRYFLSLVLNSCSYFTGKGTGFFVNTQKLHRFFDC